MLRDSKIVEKVDTVHNDIDAEASVESSPPIPDDTHVHESNTSDFEHKTEVDSTVIATSLLSPGLSLEFVDMFHQGSSGASSFSNCLEFVPESSLPLVGFNVCPPKASHIFSFPIFKSHAYYIAFACYI